MISNSESRYVKMIKCKLYCLFMKSNMMIFEVVFVDNELKIVIIFFKLV